MKLVVKSREACFLVELKQRRFKRLQFVMCWKRLLASCAKEE